MEDFMTTLIYGKDLEITEAIRLHINKLVLRKFSKFKKRVIRVHVYLEHVARKDADNKRAKVRFKVSMSRNSVVVQSTAHDLYQAVVNASERALRKVRKVKEKRIDSSR